MKLRIKNRKKQNIVLAIDEVEKPKGLVFIMHGLGGDKEEPHIKTFRDAFVESNYTTVRFDVTNSYGESDGNYADATVTNYYEDLEDVIKWSKTQVFYQEPFCLIGHSTGSMCIVLYTQNYPKKVKALAPISVSISGKHNLKTSKYKEVIKEWKKTGWWIRESTSRPGLIKKLKWSYLEDKLRYNVLLKAKILTMPALMIAGELDTGCPIEHQKLLYERLSGKKEFHIIKNAPHTFTKKRHLKEIKEIFLKWINRLE